MGRIFLVFVFAIALVHPGCGADNSTANSAPPNSPTKTSTLESQIMKIRLKKIGRASCRERV